MKKFEISVEVPAIEQQVFLRNLKDSSPLKLILENALNNEGDFFTEFSFLLSQLLNIKLLSREDAKNLFYRSTYQAPLNMIAPYFNNDDKLTRKYIILFTDSIIDVHKYIEERKKIIELKKVVWSEIPKALNNKGNITAINLDFYEVNIKVSIGELNCDRHLKRIINKIKELYKSLFILIDLKEVKFNIKVKALN